MLQLNGGQRYSFAGFATAIALIAFTTTFAGCKDKQIAMPIPVVIITDTTHKDTVITVQTTAYNYMALGDSYTIGQNVTEEARFPMQTAAILNTKTIAVNKPAIIATTGWTTNNLLKAIETAKPATNYDIVSLLIGVNDQYQLHDTTGYRDRFTLCLDKAIQLAAGNRNHVFVLSIPDYSVTPFGNGPNAAETARQIDQFNAINKSVTVSYGVAYTDVTTISRAEKNNVGMLTSDGLHPSGSQYRIWAELLAEIMIKQLK